MASALPDEIKYLGFVIDKLSEFDPAELGGENPEALDLVEAAVEPIIEGMSDLEAKEVLGRHFGLLRVWLEQPGMSESAGFYVQGALMGTGAYKYNDLSAIIGTDE